MGRRGAREPGTGRGGADMADLRRLGRRGSYRLGRLGGPPPAPPSAPMAHYPSFAPAHRGPVIAWIAAWLAGVAVIAAGALAGWWFLPFVAGLATGLAARYGRFRLRGTLPLAVLAGVAGWAAALGWLMLDGLPERAVAHEIAALAGLPPHASVGFAATLAVAAIQAAAGLWLGRALAPGRG
jgi:hypothetical protein